MTKNTDNKTKEHLGGLHRAMPIILLAFAVFLGICFITQDQTGMLGGVISGAVLGLFSIGAYFIPFLIAIHALFYTTDIKEGRLLSRVIFSFIAVIAISALTHAISNWGAESLIFDVALFYNQGALGVGGGFIGGIIAFAIMSLFGKVGVVIVSVLIFATYIVYFFSKGPMLTRIGRAALYAVVTVCAFFEKLFKNMFSKARASKESKEMARAAARNEELLDDEFFDVKGGMQTLEIPELGIAESRSPESIEANISLHDKVHHGSHSSDREPHCEERWESPRTVNAEPVGKHHKTVYDDLESYGFSEDELDRAPSDIIVEDARPSESSASNLAASVSDSADSVFARDFDPYSISESERLASKPSSRSLLEDMPSGKRPAVIDSIDDLTEEELERRRRNEAFERRKQELRSASRPASPVREQSKPVTDTQRDGANAEPRASYSAPSGYQVQREDRTPQTEHTQKVEYTPEKQEAPQKTVEFHIHQNDAPTEPVLKEDHSVTITIEKCDPPKQDAPAGYTELAFGEDTVYETVYGKPAPKTEDDPKEVVYTYEPDKAEPSDDEPVILFAESEREEEPTVSFSEPESVLNDEDKPKFKEYSVPKAQGESTGLVFEFNGEEIASRGEPLTVERTKLDGSLAIEDNGPLTLTFDVDEDDVAEPVTENDAADKSLVLEADEEADEDDEANEPLTLEFGENEDDDEWSDEEIPPEKQNPFVHEARNMFEMFKRDEPAADADEDEAVAESEAEEEDPELEPEQENEYGGDDENEYDDGEDDEPPFEIKRPERPAPEPEVKKAAKKVDYSKYKFPPIDILGIEEAHNEDQIAQEIRENTKTLIETLESFNVTASIKGVDRGPRVTRYEVVPARGVKVNQVTHLFDDIRLALAAEGVRMEAPIPGKAAIGFEIPNKKPVNVRLRELIECEEFKSSKSTSFVCLGKDVAGNPIFGDVAKFPHALVAGATGMGKSVCINSILISILYKARPDQVRFILIDPKKVEFKVYSGIPHLLIPVVTEAKQAAGALMWAVEEMERRYDLIEQHNVRNIGAYNEKVASDPSIGQPLPKIVIVIDELNDLMMQVRDPVEDLIMRIAQKARAAGIHLIIGTQRPDVRVITGTIKANINTRISCKVGQIVDSRTVLDMAGAEKLLDKGDMLFKPPDRTQPVRVQGCFVSDSEVEQIMEFLKTQTDGSLYDEEVLAEINKAAQKCGNQKKGGAASDDVDDDDEECGYYGEQQFLDAVELAIRSHKVSTALLQRKLRIGFGKAARYIDAMEEIGIVSEPNGQKPRDVLITMDEWHEKLSRVDID